MAVRAERPFLLLLVLSAGFLLKDGPFGSADADVLTMSSGSLWGSLRPRPADSSPLFTPLDAADPAVRKYIDSYVGQKRWIFQAALDRMELYRPLVLNALREAGLPDDLLYLPLVESEYVAGAVSPAGAVGLWQLMDATGRGYGLKINYWQDERRDPEKATRAAVRLLKDLHQWFDDWALALAAYNRGMYGIERDLARARSAEYAVACRRGGIPAETQEYVPNLMACILIGRNPAAYGFKVNPARLPDTEDVLLKGPLDLRIAAECAGCSEQSLREMNPSLRLWCTPKGSKPLPLRIPAGSRDRFLRKLAMVKDWTPARESSIPR